MSAGEMGAGACRQALRARSTRPSLLQELDAATTQVLGQRPRFPPDVSGPLTHSLMFSAGCSSDDSLCEPSLELEFANHRQHGEWEGRGALQSGFSGLFPPAVLFLKAKACVQVRLTKEVKVEVLRWGGNGDPQFLSTPSLPPWGRKQAAPAYTPPVMGKSLPVTCPTPGGSDSPGLKGGLVTPPESTGCRGLYCSHLDFMPRRLQAVNFTLESVRNTCPLPEA